MPDANPERPKRRWRWLLRIAQALALSALALLIWAWVTFDRAHWHEDYLQLRTHLGQAYANLLWSRDNGVDLVELDRRTRARLDEASTDYQARIVLEDFLAEFHDGHLRVDRIKLSKRIERWWAELGKDDDRDPVVLGPDTPGATACAALGFGERDKSLSPQLQQLEGLSTLADANNVFAAATLERPGGTRWGLLRIHTFGDRTMGPACVRAWDRHRSGVAAPCEQECRNAFVYGVVPNQILAELRARVEQLVAQDIDGLLVDVMHNGGGTDWVDPAARMLTTTPMACPRLAFIRHPHWSERLRARIEYVTADLEREQPPGDRETLQRAQQRLLGLAAQAEERCDLSTIWTDPADPGCSNLVEDEYYACGLFGYLPPGSLASAETRGLMFEALAYDYTPGLYDGPLVVAVDRFTASAAEYFVAMLRDNDAATIVGERTGGSGCGYTGGGVPLVLQHSQLKIKLPDCQRRRRDGSNELAGIEPDHAVSWRADDVALPSKQLLAVLDGL